MAYERVLFRRAAEERAARARNYGRRPGQLDLAVSRAGETNGPDLANALFEDISNDDTILTFVPPPEP